MMDRELCRAMG